MATMLNTGRGYLSTVADRATIPRFAMPFATIGFPALGDGPRDGYQPRLKR